MHPAPIIDFWFTTTKPSQWWAKDLQFDQLIAARFRPPSMHSEPLPVDDIGVELRRANGIASNLHFARRHRDIIARFGRYPHRNQVLGRPSTAAERKFLGQPGSAF